MIKHKTMKMIALETFLSLEQRRLLNPQNKSV